MKTALLLALLGFSVHAQPSVSTVPHVDLNKYVGLWNELYRIPNSFQDNSSRSTSICFNTTAEYAALPDDKVSVTNTCTREIDGKRVPDVAQALAAIVDKTSNAKLVVNFTGIAVLRWLGIGNGDYWILGLGPVNSEKRYEWALVGSPSLKYGWILARKKTLSPGELAKIFEIAKSNGYSQDAFILTQRP